MAGIKAQLPDVQTLEQRLGEVFGVGMADFLAQTSIRREKVIQMKKQMVNFGVLFVLAFVALALLQSFLAAGVMGGVVALTLLIGIPLAMLSNRWYKEQKALTQELNLALIPTITACFNRQILYTRDSAHNEETRSILNTSELLTDSFDTLEADDMFSFFEPYPLSAREIKVTRREQRGKNSVTVALFHGVLVEATLPKTLTGVTFVSTEGDKSGFGHQDFWGNLFSKKQLVETKLEWNQFENDLHVATTDEIEARYVLTTNFMSDLHDWWSEHKENIRIVFRGNKVYMLLPDTKVKMGMSTTSTDTNELKAYALTILRPLWRTLSLIENIRI